MHFNKLTVPLLFMFLLSTLVAGPAIGKKRKKRRKKQAEPAAQQYDDEIVEREPEPEPAPEIGPDGQPIPQAQPQQNGSNPSGMVVDTELVEDESKKVENDIVGLNPSDIWYERNGVGLNLGLGGMSCTGDYCQTTLGTSIFGSFAGRVGIYYRKSPNLSFFGDATFAYLNTAWNQGATNGVASEKDGAFLFNFLLGLAVHLPVKGWMDNYASIGVGPIIMKAKADIQGGHEFTHHWKGIDFEIGLGSNFYFWSVGALKNLSIGPYMRMGFPIWPSLCSIEDVDAAETCKKPSDHSDTKTYNWNKTPFTFQAGIELKYDFGWGGDSPKQEESSNSMSMTGEIQLGSGDKPADSETKSNESNESNESDETGADLGF